MAHVLATGTALAYVPSMQPVIAPPQRFRSGWFALVVVLGLLALLAVLMAVVLWVMARPASSPPGQAPGPITRFERPASPLPAREAYSPTRVG